MIDSFRLLTYSRDAHRFFFMIPFKIEIQILALRRIYAMRGNNGLRDHNPILKVPIMFSAL